MPATSSAAARATTTRRAAIVRCERVRRKRPRSTVSPRGAAARRDREARPTAGLSLSLWGGEVARHGRAWVRGRRPDAGGARVPEPVAPLLQLVADDHGARERGRCQDDLGER